MTDKQRYAYYLKKRFILLSGPRFCGKTVASLKRVVKEAWEKGNERTGSTIGVFAETIKTGTGGIWKGLYLMLQEWEKEGIEGPDGVPFGIVNGTSFLTTRGATRQYYMQIRNQWGATAEFQLHSLEYEGDVERKFMSTEFSCLYFSELQHFKSRSSFDIPIMQLRSMSGAFKYDDFLYIADTNPPEEGTEHWAWDVFFVDPVAEEPPENLKSETEIASWKRSQQEFEAVQFTLDDNPLADPRDIENVKNAYAGDAEAWNRFVLGTWTKGIGVSGTHFGREFRAIKNTVVVGDCSSQNEDEWDVIVPLQDTRTLYCGWDTGETNHAFCIVQKRFVNGKSYWDVLDEVVSIKQEVMLEDFGEACFAKMKKYDESLGKDIDWVAWGDTSLDRFRANSSEGTDATVIEIACEHRIKIRMASDAKKPRTVRRRLTMLKNLLQHGRLFISANCRYTLEMFEQMRKGKTDLQIIMRGDPRKHIFDALTYVIFSEMMEDMEIEDMERPVTSNGSVSMIHGGYDHAAIVP